MGSQAKRASLRSFECTDDDPARQEDADADREQPRAGAERAGRDQIDEQQPHTDELGEPCKVVNRPLSSRQIRSKFFSISRRVRRSITGRPCGQTVE